MRGIFRIIFFAFRRPKMALFMGGIIFMFFAVFLLFFGVQYVIGDLNTVDLNYPTYDLGAVKTFGHVAGYTSNAWGHFSVKSSDSGYLYYYFIPQFDNDANPKSIKKMIVIRVDSEDSKKWNALSDYTQKRFAHTISTPPEPMHVDGYAYEMNYEFREQCLQGLQKNGFSYAEPLAESIAQNGILQPISVRKKGFKYELITGERRLRAAKMCGFPVVPCIVHEISDRHSAVLALVENIQRQDLSFFDEASAIEKLIADYGMTQEIAASKLGRAQSTIANKLRLLRLTEKERSIIIQYGLTERHARSLLRLGSSEDRLFILDKIIRNNLNVERSERLIDEFIGNQRNRTSYKKRSVVFQNVKMFVNTINKAVDTMQAAGISADSRKIQSEDYIEYRVRIPIQKKN